MGSSAHSFHLSICLHCSLALRGWDTQADALPTRLRPLSATMRLEVAGQEALRTFCFFAFAACQCACPSFSP